MSALAYCGRVLYAYDMKPHKAIVSLDGNKAFTTSLIIAEGCNVQHRSVMKLLQFGSKSKILSGYKILKVATRGRPVEHAVLTETQAIFLINLMKNSDIVFEFKERLTLEFIALRETVSNLIAQRQDPDWQNVRKDGKKVYMPKAETIKGFVDYATAQGSKNAQHYYSNLANMENKALFFFEQRYKNLREVLTIRQLMQVATADGVVEKALKDGMDQGLPYKECYALAKERIIAYAEIIGQSPVLALALTSGGATK